MAAVSPRIEDCHVELTPNDLRYVVTRLLREVDPLAVVDGLDVVDEHEEAANG